MGFNYNRQWLVRVPNWNYKKFERMILNFEPPMKLLNFFEYAPDLYAFQCKLDDIRRISDVLYDEDFEHDVWFIRRLSWNSSYDKGFMKSFKNKNTKYCLFAVQ